MKTQQLEINLYPKFHVGQKVRIIMAHPVYGSGIIGEIGIIKSTLGTSITIFFPHRFLTEEVRLILSFDVWAFEVI